MEQAVKPRWLNEEKKGRLAIKKPDTRVSGFLSKLND
jgi:hypothetical protein